MWTPYGTLCCVADLQKRGSYTPRRAREQRAYRMVVTGGVAGAVAVVGIVLAIAGVVGAWLPILALIVAALAVAGFRHTVGR
jgi:fatty acid desaturase